MENSKCKKCNTGVCKEGELCSSCQSKEYYNKRRRGEIIELRLDMTKVKQSTYLQIMFLIQKDTEENK